MLSNTILLKGPKYIYLEVYRRLPKRFSAFASSYKAK